MVLKMTNPLSKYFRQPSIFIKLPSKGNHYPDRSLDMPANGELPVLPMTAVDEITYRTPDGLFNGSSTVEVIKSCVPNILDPWNMPAMDLDSVLIGIRIASYGHDMDISTTCPNCGTAADHQLDLRVVLDTMPKSDYSQPFTRGDLTIYFQPMTYRQINANNAIQFEEQKMLNILPDSGIDADKKTQMISDAFKKITDMTIRALGQSIKMIQTPSAQVTELEHIIEFLRNCDRKTFEGIRDRILALKAANEIKPLNLKCGNCSHEYEQAVTLDMSNFFA